MNHDLFVDTNNTASLFIAYQNLLNNIDDVIDENTVSKNFMTT